MTTTSTLTQPPPLRLHAEAPWNTPPTREHLEQIAAARTLGAKVRRGMLVSTLSAWTIAIFAGLTIMTSLFSPGGMILGVGMAVVAAIEFGGTKQLKRLDPAAPKKLAMNQLVLAGLLVAYGGYSLWSSLTQPSELMKALGPDAQMTSMVAEIEQMTRTISIALYGSIMLAGLAGPGLTAWFYYSRAKHLKNYVEQTPQWILELQRAGMNI